VPSTSDACEVVNTSRVLNAVEVEGEACYRHQLLRVRTRRWISFSFVYESLVGFNKLSRTRMTMTDSTTLCVDIASDETSRANNLEVGDRRPAKTLRMVCVYN